MENVEKVEGRHYFVVSELRLKRNHKIMINLIAYYIFN